MLAEPPKPGGSSSWSTELPVGGKKSLNIAAKRKEPGVRQWLRLDLDHC